MSELYNAVISKQPDYYPEPEYKNDGCVHEFVWSFADGTKKENQATLVLEGVPEEFHKSIIDKYADEILKSFN